MQLKVTRSGPRTYLQIVHAYRDPETGRPKQRHIANLGRADQLCESDLDTLINGLLKFTNPLFAEPDAKGTRIRAKADSNSREKGQRFERKGTL